MELDILSFFQEFLESPEAVTFNMTGHHNKVAALEALLAFADEQEETKPWKAE